jgi:hypothetical protein
MGFTERDAYLHGIPSPDSTMFDNTPTILVDNPVTFARSQFRNLLLNYMFQHNAAIIRLKYMFEVITLGSLNIYRDGSSLVIR